MYSKLYNKFKERIKTITLLRKINLGENIVLKEDTMKIMEVSEKYNIPTATLRYYERIGIIPPVNRNKSGIRDYTEQDCAAVEFAQCMRSAGVSIEGLIEYMRLFQEGDKTREARQEILLEEKANLEKRIEEMTAVSERLEYKLKNYYKCDNIAKKVLSIKKKTITRKK